VATGFFCWDYDALRWRQRYGQVVRNVANAHWTALKGTKNNFWKKKMLIFSALPEWPLAPE
jgi:hypothetical protein